MYIFISYFSTKKSSLLVNKEKINLPVKFNNKKNKKLKSLKKAQTNLRLNQFLKDLEPKIRINRAKRVNILKRYKQSLSHKIYQTNENLTKNNITEQILETLSLFTDKKIPYFFKL